MKRDDKLNALRQLLQGEPINKVFPPVRIIIVDQFTETHSLLMGDVGCKEIPHEQVSKYLDKVKQENPLKRLDINRISKQEFDRLEAKLESEY